MEYAVITALGPDRRGIMDDLAGSVAAGGANIEETKAAILGGEFAVIMLVAGSAEALGKLKATMPDDFAAKDLAVAVRLTDGPVHPRGLPYIIESVSLDTPGIVLAITRVLRSHGINIEELESMAEAAPLSGAPLFRMRIRINITPGARLSALKEDLAKTAEEHDLDIAVKPLPGIPEV
jgi:glycine cleavage system transcriptional repressor